MAWRDNTDRSTSRLPQLDHGEPISRWAGDAKTSPSVRILRCEAHFTTLRSSLATQHMRGMLGFGGSCPARDRFPVLESR